LTEVLIILLVLGAAMVVFYPVLAGTAPGKQPPSGSAQQTDQEERARLIEQQQRLFRNLAELEEERSAGRIAEADYQDHKRRDEAQAAGVLRQLDALRAPARASRRGKRISAETAKQTAAPARRRLGTTLAWVGGIAAFAVVLGITMSKAVAPRASGGTITGSIPGGDAGPAEGAGGDSPMLPKANPARLAELERLISRDSSNVKTLLEAGHLYLAERKLDQAARVTLKALQLDSASAEGYAHIAVLLMAEASSHENPDSARRAVDGALDAVNHSLELQPGLAEGWLFKGMVLMAGKRDMKAAAAAWKQYLKVAPPGADTTRIHAIVEAAGQ
jgi:tetratricopeptide (TPR) repeat protein